VAGRRLQSNPDFPSAPVGRAFESQVRPSLIIRGDWSMRLAQALQADTALLAENAPAQCEK
jgi:hypothetical protein